MSFNDCSDDKLVAAAGEGDRQAYGELVKRHANRIYAVCLSVLGNAHDAEDVVQVSLIKGFTQLRGLRDKRQFAPWLVRIARNACRDHLRKRRRDRQTVLDTVTPQRPTDEHRPDLQAAIRQLPEQYRLPLILYYFNGRCAKSVAYTLGIAQATVHTRLSRARRRLRQILSSSGDMP